MAFETKIEWVDHTFNPWIGCTRVSSACDNCYAAAMSHRRGWAEFEAGAPRKRTTAAYWRQPPLWNKKAQAAGVRRKVFGPSLADPFDAEIADDWRRDYIALIEQCDWLDFILLTKRPQVAVKFFAGRKVPDNLWPGITAENQKMLDLRAPAMLSIDARVHVLSAEPLLGSLDLVRVELRDGQLYNALRGAAYIDVGEHHQVVESPDWAKFGWVIAGGESGAKARPTHPDWFRALRDQCAAAGVPFFFKQWGEWQGGSSFEKPKARRLAMMNDGRSAEPGLRYQLAALDREAAVPPRNATYMTRVGKKAAGALLDGVEYRDAPS